MIVQSPVLLAAAAIRAQGFASLPVRDMSDRLAVIRRGLWRILNDESGAMQRAFTIDPSRYERDELDEPLEIGILKKKKGRVKQGKELGFFDRAAGRQKDDPNKERFHYAPSLLALISEETRSAHAKFLTALSDINTEAHNIALVFASEMDRVNGMLPREHLSTYVGSFVERITSSCTITRLVRYRHVAGRVSDAKVHRDRDFLSVHHYSNASGLCFFDKKDDRIEVDNEVDPSSVSIFTGEKFWAVTRGVFGTGALHGVFDRRRAQESLLDEERFAVVSFIHVPLETRDLLWLRAHLDEIHIDQGRFQTC